VLAGRFLVEGETGRRPFRQGYKAEINIYPVKKARDDVKYAIRWLVRFVNSLLMKSI
jgi:hypothetical protein